MSWQPSAASPRLVPVWAVFSAGLAPVLLIGAWMVAGALQSASYSPVRQTVSVLAGYAGTDRWIMTAALFLVGACHLVTAAGLAGVRACARILLMVAGLASIGIAASPEPVHGPSPAHLAWTVVGATAITLWPALAARTAPRPWILSFRVAAAVCAVLITLLGWLIIEAQGGVNLGLAERLTSAAQTSWPFIVALTLRRGTPPPARPELPPQTAGRFWTSVSRHRGDPMASVPITHAHGMACCHRLQGHPGHETRSRCCCPGAAARALDRAGLWPRRHGRFRSSHQPSLVFMTSR